MNSKKQYTKSGVQEVYDQFFENLISPIHFLLFDSTKFTENIWEKSSFRKTDHGLLCTPDLVYCSFEFISNTFFKEKESNVLIWEELVGFEIP